MHIASVNTVINSYYVNITRYLNKQAIAKIVGRLIQKSKKKITATKTQLRDSSGGIVKCPPPYTH